MENQEFDKLLKNYSQSRDKIEGYISKVEEMMNQVENVFPKKLDYRNKYVLDDKIKTFTGFFQTLLNMRKEVNATIVKEIELRKKLQTDGDDEEPLTKEDLRVLAKQIENQNEPKEKHFDYPIEENDITEQIEKFKVFQQ